MDFRILGPLEVRDGDREVRLRGGKQRALLALLLVNANRTLAIDRIVDELWGEDVPETAQKMVQIYVSHLRKVLPRGALHTRPPGYAFQLEPDELDLHRFERLVAEARAALDAGRAAEASGGFRAALELWRGPALAEFAFEPFAPAEGARLEELRVYALEGRLEADLLLGRHGDLVGELEALIARHPLREGLRRQHMLALYRSGRQAEALAAYQEARRTLADQLGIEPSPALRELERQILQQHSSLDLTAPPAAPSEAVPAPAAAHTAVLPPASAAPAAVRPVGRDPDLGRLSVALREALAGERRLVFVSGEAGIGKTTLVEAFLAEAGQGEELLVGRGQCIEQHGAGEAYMPVLEALGRICRGPAGEQLAAVLLERAPAWAIQMPALFGPDVLGQLRQRMLGGTRERMLRELVEALDALAGLRPVVLVLEDLHWSDYSTVDLVTAIARRREPARLLVVGTFRPADARTRSHPIHRTVPELRLRGLAAEVAVASFGESDVETYLAARLPRNDLPADVPRLLVERTAGNPLFLETVVDAWIDEGRVRPDDGTWLAATDLAELTRDVPETLRQLIAQRLLDVSEEDRRILEAASVAGPEFSAALVAAACERPEQEVEARCDELAADAVFLVSRGAEGWPDGTIAGRFGFTHELCREVLYESLSSGRRGRLHRTIGARLEQAYGQRGHELAAELAVHFVRGGDALGAVRHLRLAAERARDRRAPRETMEHLQGALALLGGLSDETQRAESELVLQAMLGPALIAVNGWSSPDAEAALVRARELADELDRSDERALSTYMLATLYEVQGKYDAAEVVLEETLAEQPTTPGVAAEAYELLACTLFHQGAFARALENAERGLAVYDDAYQNPWTVDYSTVSPATACHSWAALSLWFLGYPDQARERARRAAELCEGPSRARGLATALVQVAVVAQCRLDVDETLASAEAAVEAATQMGFAYRVAIGTIVRGWALAAKGELEEGVGELRRGLELARATGARMDDAYFLGLLADACTRASRFAEARAALAAALENLPRGGRFFYEAELHRLRGELLLREGERDEGEAALRRAVEVAQAQGSPSLVLRAALSLARALREQGRVDEARSLVVRAHAAFTEGFETADLRAAAALLRELGGQAPAPAPTLRPELRPGARGRVGYARSGDLSIAYEVTGHGAVDLVLVPGFLSQLDRDWDEPRHARFLERLGSFSRLIRFDKRGTGLSDRPQDVPDLETRMDDVRAVMDAARSERAVLLGYSEGAPMSILFAASHPERVAALVLYGGYAKRMGPDEDYPWAPTVDERRRHNESILGDAGFERQLRLLAPSADEAMARWWGERCRASASPGAVSTLLEMNSRIDVRSLLPAVHLPTLVVHRVGDLRVRVDEGRYIADRIPGARFVELPGDDHFVAVEPDQILDVVEPFVAEIAGVAHAVDTHRSLATVLVTDIVGSTETATRLGDRPWADLLARYHEFARAELARFSGEEVDAAGDGFLALFDGPSRAIRCGLAIKERAAQLGLSIRVGLHTGEIERRGRAARGIAVHLAARVAAEASPGAVLVTATTRDLVAGSGLRFADGGERRLKGFDEPRRLFAAQA
jgi:DNA-binding SARP family transcriptional activator/class 3 adenylate cyclase/predicted ATPase